MAQEQSSGTASSVLSPPEVIEVFGVGKKVTRSAYLKFARQRGLNLLVETAHKSPGYNSLTEIRNGTLKALTIIDTAIVVEAMSAVDPPVVQPSAPMSHMNDWFVAEMERAFRFGWIAETGG